VEVRRAPIALTTRTPPRLSRGRYVGGGCWLFRFLDVGAGALGSRAFLTPRLTVAPEVSSLAISSTHHPKAPPLCSLQLPQALTHALAASAAAERPSTTTGGGSTLRGFLERTDPASLAPQMLQLRPATSQRGSPFGSGGRGSMAGTTPAFLMQKRAEQEEESQQVGGVALSRLTAP
jgi:hypothetical protein